MDLVHRTSVCTLSYIIIYIIGVFRFVDAGPARAIELPLANFFCCCPLKVLIKEIIVIAKKYVKESIVKI